MDQGTLLEIPLDDGERFVEQFVADGNRVHVAFWARESVEDPWFLYLAADIYDREGPARAYRAAETSISKLGKLDISGSELKIISPNNPIAKAALAFIVKHPQRAATGNTMFGQMHVAHAIFYPGHTRSQAMTFVEIAQEVFRRLVSPARQPARVVLKDGTTFVATPVGLDMQYDDATNSKVTVATFHENSSPERKVELNDIASIGAA